MHSNDVFERFSRKMWMSDVQFSGGILRPTLRLYGGILWKLLQWIISSQVEKNIILQLGIFQPVRLKPINKHKRFIEKRQKKNKNRGKESWLDFFLYYHSHIPIVKKMLLSIITLSDDQCWLNDNIKKNTNNTFFNYFLKHTLLLVNLNTFV